MPSHLSSIGVPITSSEALQALASRLLPDADVYGTAAGRYFRCRSASGAELWLQADRKKRLMGANPHFAGASRVRLGLTERFHHPDDTELDGAFHAWVEPPEDDPTTGTYPLVFDVPDAARFRSLALPRVEEVQLAAFAHELSVWPSEAAYLEAHAERDSPALAVRSFVPSGLFTAQGEPAADREAQAILTGVVQHAERLDNEHGGGAFYWLLVDSFGGSFDVVCDPELLEQSPPEGAVVQGAFWLSGRLLGHDVVRRGLVHRLFHR